MSDRIRRKFYDDVLGQQGVYAQEERAAKTIVIDRERQEKLFSVLTPLEVFQMQAGKAMIESLLCQDSGDRAVSLIQKEEISRAIQDRTGDIAERLRKKSYVCIGLGLAVAKAKTSVDAGLDTNASPGLFENEEEKMDILTTVMMQKEQKCGCQACQKALALFRFSIENIDKAVKEPWSDEFSEFMQKQGDDDECIAD